MRNLQEAIGALRNHNPVLVYDEDGREEEIDIIIPAEDITSKHISMLRNNAGGLICVAVHPSIAKIFGIPFMTDVLKAASGMFPTLSKILLASAPYGDPPAFSLTINHKDTYTGITDNDRALTIRELAKIGGEALQTDVPPIVIQKNFEENFRSPGHVHLLIGGNTLLSSRKGHTELSLALAEMAEITPIMVICEMLDGDSGRALPKTSASEYAKRTGHLFIEGKAIAESYKEYRGSLREEAL